MKIGVVVPAHNEEQHLPACLQSIQEAIEKVPMNKSRLWLYLIVVRISRAQLYSATGKLD